MIDDSRGKTGRRCWINLYFVVEYDVTRERKKVRVSVKVKDHAFVPRLSTCGHAMVVPGD